MNFIKNTAACVICVLVMAGCAGQQKKGVKPIPGATREAQPFPYPEADVNSQPVETMPKNIIQPSAIMLPGQEELPMDIQQGQQGPLPSMDTVNDRIFEYGRKLERWQEIDKQTAALQLNQQDTEKMVNCFVDLQKVIDGYNRLRADMLQLNTSRSSVTISTEDVITLQKSDISFLESVCGRLLAPAEGERIDWEQREEGTDLSQLETLIERYTGSREYEEVIQVWQRIPQHQIERINLRTKILYGNALMFLHQEERAAEIYQQIVDEMSASDEQRTDLLSLRKVLADLYTASGNYTAAKKQYQSMSKEYQDLGSIEEWSKLQLDILERSDEGGPELVEFSGLLRNFLGFIPERDGFKITWEADTFLRKYPYSAVASNVDIIKTVARAKAEKWFDGFFVDVDQLAKEKKYVDAIEKLEAIPGDIVSTEQKEQIKEKNEGLILAEAVERETRKIEKIQELQRSWNDGLKLADEGKYDEAIAIFNTLLQTEYFARAEDKIQEIILLAAKTDRRAAADLYIRYTKTTDLEMKKKLLVESRRLLSNILVKYPTVNIIDKVRGNIQKVDEEINTLDPLLLQSIRNAESGLGGPPVVGEQPDDDLTFSLPAQAEPPEVPVKEEDLPQ